MINITNKVITEIIREQTFFSMENNPLGYLFMNIVINNTYYLWLIKLEIFIKTFINESKKIVSVNSIMFRIYNISANKLIIIRINC